MTSAPDLADTIAPVARLSNLVAATTNFDYRQFEAEIPEGDTFEVGIEGGFVLRYKRGQGFSLYDDEQDDADDSTLDIEEVLQRQRNALTTTATSFTSHVSTNFFFKTSPWQSCVFDKRGYEDDNDEDEAH